MKNVVSRGVLLGMFCLTLYTPDANAGRVEMNYQGRVKVQGHPFTGTDTSNLPL